MTAATSGPFASITRTQLSEDALDDAVETALADGQTKAVLAEVPGGASRLDTGGAEAYRIVDTVDDSGPITQVLKPVRERDATLGYASSGDGTAVGIELEDGRYLQSIDHPAQATAAVEHKHVAKGREKQEILDRIESEQDLSAYDEQEATINVVEESGIAYAQIPASDTGSSNAADSALIASVDLDSQNVTIQGETTDCVISCLATRPRSGESAGPAVASGAGVDSVASRVQAASASH